MTLHNDDDPIVLHIDTSPRALVKTLIEAVTSGVISVDTALDLFDQDVLPAYTARVLRQAADEAGRQANEPPKQPLTHVQSLLNTRDWLQARADAMTPQQETDQ